jgi:chaperonin cofactor prefoldin
MAALDDLRKELNDKIESLEKRVTVCEGTDDR